MSTTYADRVWMASPVQHGIAHEVSSWDEPSRQAKLLCGWEPDGGRLVSRDHARFELQAYGCVLCRRIRDGGWTG